MALGNSPAPAVLRYPTIAAARGSLASIGTYMKANSLLALVLAFAAGASQAHAHLESSEPKAASTLASAPTTIRLQFNEAVERAFSRIVLRDAAKHEIALPKPTAASPKEVSVALPALPAGEYQVQWSTVSHDGHKAKGEFAFRVK